jgi:macrodomain Ter protein organizer (MatP/YcbG family)
LKRQVALYLTVATYSAVAKLAKEQGVTFSDQARQLINEAIQARKEKDK